MEILIQCLGCEIFVLSRVTNYIQNYVNKLLELQVSKKKLGRRLQSSPPEFFLRAEKCNNSGSFFKKKYYYYVDSKFEQIFNIVQKALNKKP